MFMLSIYYILFLGAIGCKSFPNVLVTNEDQEFEQNYAVSYGAPLISPLQPTIILELNTDFILRCEDEQPIEWKWTMGWDIKHEIKDFKPLDVKRLHGLELRLFNVTHYNVGYYFCIQTVASADLLYPTNSELIELSDQNKASHIYVFVNDPDHLLVEPDDYPLIEAHQYEDVIVPCKPTMPNTEILLTTPNDTTFSSRTTARYNPQMGFVVVIHAITEAGNFKCLPKDPSPSNEFEILDIHVEFIGKLPYINKPHIRSESRGHAIENENFTLICEVKIDNDVSFIANWTTPKDVDPSRIFMSMPQRSSGKGIATLTVFNAQKTDSGQYKCSFTDHSRNTAYNFYTMTVLGANESYINMSEPTNYYNIVDRANKKITINVKYRGYPWPTLRWYRPDNTEIIQGHKYNITTTDSATTLEIKNTEMIDSGIYTVVGTNGNVRKSLQFNVTVSDAPRATLDNIQVQAGAEAEGICHILAHPPPEVFWTFTNCRIKPRWPTCDQEPSLIMNSSRVEKGARIVDHTHRLYFTPKTPGILRCIVKNSIDKGTDGIGHVLLADISDNMTVYGVDENTKIARGDEIIITCAALAYYFTEDVYWFKAGEMVKPNEDVEITTLRTDYSYKKTIRFKSIKDKDQGSYECRAWPIRDDQQKESKFIDVFVHEPSKPIMQQTNLIQDTEINLKLGNPLELECKAEGIPRPNVLWYKDDVKINNNERENFDIVEENTKLIVQHIMPGDEGVYKCIASNRLGEVDASVQVAIVDLPGISMAWIMAIIIFIALLLILVVYLCVRVHRERRLLKELKAAGLENFEEGAIEHLNPALSLDEQADLLPYDRNFEFPRDKLKLGKQLGAGAFGVVLKAYAEGIKPDEKESVVAVKMVKRTADNEVMRALVSELKVMIHLGQHLNVVNLLGAVTKNIVKKELMVIVEYCRFGNVQNVLLKNRKHFINQINPQTDKIDPNYVCTRLSEGFETNRNSESDPRSGTRAGRPNSSGYTKQADLYEGRVDSCHTVMTTVPEDDNSSQPAWRSNYKPDSNEAMTITTSDLISWAFQVARGMDYLSSRRVLHGDLAARNILLCEDNVVKICDFGLARTMYNSNNYKKQGEAPLPIKWLALESLSDQVFSTYTDVWSYGIVLWEFFSLAKVPYTGMDANQNLYIKLKDGYRMEKPPFANDELYDIMLECWSANPESRPLFNILEKRFARMLGDEVTNHYMDLNEPYLRSNIDWAARQDIYLHTHPGSPKEIAPSPPGYINGHIVPEIHPQHSPTLKNNLDRPSNKNLEKEGIEPEEIPMLQHHDKNDRMSEYLDNSEIKSIPTPLPRPSIAETRLNGDNNYVNLKQSPQKILNNKKNYNGRSIDAFSNPSYQALRQQNK